MHAARFSCLHQDRQTDRQSDRQLLSPYVSTDRVVPPKKELETTT